MKAWDSRGLKIFLISAVGNERSANSASTAPIPPKNIDQFFIVMTDLGCWALLMTFSNTRHNVYWKKIFRSLQFIFKNMSDSSLYISIAALSLGNSFQYLVNGLRSDRRFSLDLEGPK